MMAHMVTWKYGPYDCRVCLYRPFEEVPSSKAKIVDGDLACDTDNGVTHARCCDRCVDKVEQ
jgi:hypothetical protein